MVRFLSPQVLRQPMGCIRVSSLSRVHKLALSAVGAGTCVAVIANKRPSEADVPPSQEHGGWAAFSAARAGALAWDLIRTVSLVLLPPKQAQKDGPVQDTLAGKISTVLMRLSEEPKYRELLVGIGGTVLLDWVIRYATARPGSFEQRNVECTLINLLNTGCTAGVVLSHEGALSKLLTYAASGNDCMELMKAMQGALKSMQPNTCVAAGDIALLLNFFADSGQFGPEAAGNGISCLMGGSIGLECSHSGTYQWLQNHCSTG